MIMTYLTVMFLCFEKLFVVFVYCEIKKIVKDIKLKINVSLRFLCEFTDSIVNIFIYSFWNLWRFLFLVLCKSIFLVVFLLLYV